MTKSEKVYLSAKSVRDNFFLDDPELNQGIVPEPILASVKDDLIKARQGLALEGQEVAAASPTLA